MAECKQCGKEYVAKRSTSAYCGPKCKQDFYRNRIKPVTVTSVTLSNANPVTVTNAKPGVVWESESGAATKIAEIVRGPDIKYQMTVMERLFYRPNQTNFVSLPSRACYGVV